MSEFGAVLFHTTSAAMRAEKALTEAGLNVKLIPTPREFSSDCGIALRFEWRAVEEVRRLLAQARVETSDVQPLE